MRMPITEQRSRAWEVFAQTWVDTSYSPKDQDAFAQKLNATELTVSELYRIALWEVCGAFSVFTTICFVTAGMALPDWDYPDDLARKKVETWVKRPWLLSLINPLWLIGYPLSVALTMSTMFQVFRKLKALRHYSHDT